MDALKQKRPSRRSVRIYILFILGALAVLIMGFIASQMDAGINPAAGQTGIMDQVTSGINNIVGGSK